ncbi:hypothetical protein NVP1113A_05 [Vibrio phage 1.113.A._10N.286.51.E7]|nr:hypothetical protein NVP1113A_05 [Vibrio phage 1.113.A._10N.286.51.E7]
MPNYVKFNEQTSEESEATIDLTAGKAYKVIGSTEAIVDNAGDEIEIMTPNWDMDCVHIGGARWVWCDEDGVES